MASFFGWIMLVGVSVVRHHSTYTAPAYPKRTNRVWQVASRTAQKIEAWLTCSLFKSVTLFMKSAPPKMPTSPEQLQEVVMSVSRLLHVSRPSFELPLTTATHAKPLLAWRVRNKHSQATAWNAQFRKTKRTQWCSVLCCSRHVLCCCLHQA